MATKKKTVTLYYHHGRFSSKQYDMIVSGALIDDPLFDDDRQRVVFTFEKGDTSHMAICRYDLLFRRPPKRIKSMPELKKYVSNLISSREHCKFEGYVKNDEELMEFIKRNKDVHFDLFGYFTFNAPSKDAVIAAGNPEKKTTPKKKAAKKPSQVKTVRKLVSEGKIPAGHVRRLGIRKQTPPPPKSRKADEKRKAMLAGYRVSKNGNLYYETRENRSDKPHEKPRRGRRVPVKTTPKKRK